VLLVDIFDPPIRNLDKRQPASLKIKIDADLAAVWSLSFRAMKRIFRVGVFCLPAAIIASLVGNEKVCASPSFLAPDHFLAQGLFWHRGQASGLTIKKRLRLAAVFVDDVVHHMHGIGQKYDRKPTSAAR
jgi:hypothetical protein